MLESYACNIAGVALFCFDAREDAFNAAARREEDHDLLLGRAQAYDAVLRLVLGRSDLTRAQIAEVCR